MAAGRNTASAGEGWWRGIALPVIGVLVGAAGIASCLLLVTSSLRQHETAVAVARLQADVLTLAAIENGIEANEEHAELTDLMAAEQRVRTNLRELIPQLPAGTAGQLGAETQAFITAVDTTVTGFLSASGDVSDLDRFDNEVTEPIFEELTARLDALVQQADEAAHESARGAVRGLVIIIVLMGGAAAATLFFDARTQRRAGARHEAARLDARFRAIVENLREYVLVVDDDGDVRYASPSIAAERLVPSDATNINEMLQGLTPESRALLSEVLQAATPEPVQIETADVTGAVRHLEIVVSDQRSNPHVAGMVITARDITTQVRLQQRLREQALTDELSGLPNRRALNEASESAISRARRDHALVGLVIVDVDGFKGVNDALGHMAGDELLVAITNRLRRVCRSDEVLARMGGDEFAVLVEGVRNVGQVAAVACRMREAVDEPYELGEHVIAVQASFGVAVAGASDGYDDLFRHADVALYEAKERGRNQVVTYEPGMDGRSQTELRLRREMVKGFASGEFTLAYQPLLDVRTRRPIGVEALMRWDSAMLGRQSPAEFIPAAERSGMIVALGRWALRTACIQLSEWQRENLVDDLSMSVNVSVAQLQDDRFVDDLEQIIAETGVAPRCLVLEVTESMLAGRPDEIAAVLRRVRALGVKVALDDFGSGYSSMGQLQRLPVDEIKIDRGFVQALSDGTAASRSVAGMLFALGRSMGLRTVAEGVEEIEQFEVLCTQQCDIAQGFLFARPMPPAEALDFLRTSAMAALGSSDAATPPARRPTVET